MIKINNYDHFDPSGAQYPDGAALAKNTTKTEKAITNQLIYIYIGENDEQCDAP